MSLGTGQLLERDGLGYSLPTSGPCDLGREYCSGNYVYKILLPE